MGRKEDLEWGIRECDILLDVAATGEAALRDIGIDPNELSIDPEISATLGFEDMSQNNKLSTQRREVNLMAE